jgi:hypothetical protein
VKRYGLHGERSRDLLTHGGRVLWHDSKPELEFLVPGVRVVELPPDLPPDQCLPIREHPDFASTSFPLRRQDFR